MKSLKSSVIALTATLFVFACSQNRTTEATNANQTIAVSNSTPQPSATLDELAAARKNYSALCIECHKEGGLGGTSQVDGKKIKAPNFTSERMMHDEDADWIDSITNGLPDDGMPAFKEKLSAQEIKDLIKLIRKDFQKK